MVDLKKRIQLDVKEIKSINKYMNGKWKFGLQKFNGAVKTGMFNQQIKLSEKFIGMQKKYQQKIVNHKIEIYNALNDKKKDLNEIWGFDTISQFIKIHENNQDVSKPRMKSKLYDLFLSPPKIPAFFTQTPISKLFSIIKNLNIKPLLKEIDRVASS